MSDGQHVAVATSTQQLYPWRATVRTIVQFIVTLAAAAPILYSAVMQQDAGLAVGGFSTALGVAAAITRLMASPATDEILKKFAPWLASEPKA